MKKETFERAKELQEKICNLQEALTKMKEEKTIFLSKWIDSTYESRLIGILKLKDEDLEHLKEMIENILKKAKEEFEEL